MALHQPRLSYVEVTRIAEGRIKGFREASLDGKLADHADRAVGAYALWHDLTRAVQKAEDNQRLAKLAGMKEPILW